MNEIDSTHVDKVELAPYLCNCDLVALDQRLRERLRFADPVSCHSSISVTSSSVAHLFIAAPITPFTSLLPSPSSSVLFIFLFCSANSDLRAVVMRIKWPIVENWYYEGIPRLDLHALEYQESVVVVSVTCQGEELITRRKK